MSEVLVQRPRPEKGLRLEVSMFAPKIVMFIPKVAPKNCLI